MTELRVFLETNIQTPLDWIPYLPKPGAFKHPTYGDLTFTPERLESFVTNFNAHVYQDRVPLDAEHQTKLSGAAGWITELRQNEDGSVDAKTEWTDRGKFLIANDRFRYVSPEFYDEWQDPATGVTYKDVAIGGALTTRPFFKNAVLRPLVATEDGTFVLVEDDTDDAVLSVQPKEDKQMADKPDVQEAVDAKAFAEVQVRLTELQTALEGSEKARQEAETRSQKFQEDLDVTTAKLTKMEEAALTKRLTEMADGHDGDRWYGDVAAHVTIMRTLTEGSDAFTSYVKMQQDIAKVNKTSALFQEIGSSEETQAETSLQKINRLADELRKTKPTLTQAQAFTEALEANPQLYTDYRKGE